MRPPRVLVLLVGSRDLALAHAARGEQLIVEAAADITSRCAAPPRLGARA